MAEGLAHNGLQTSSAPSTSRGVPVPVSRTLSWGPIALIVLYRWTLSPFVGGQCRYQPTCSRYGLDAYRTHGVWRGTVLTVGRILRCHPFVRGGFDPIPSWGEPRSRPVHPDDCPRGPVQTDHRTKGGANR